MASHPTATENEKRIVYGLVFLSGLAALIYQVVWHKYLSILLGAQARATAVTLAIFLGGISLGYAAFGRWSRTKKWNLLFAYCLVELGLAAWALTFPYLFRAVFSLTPMLYAQLGVESLWIDIALSISLLGVPTFLMGGTLPLLTQGLSENLAQASSTHARIYGFNTIGSCFGCLLAGYFLIPLTDLPAAVTIGAILNTLVAGVTYFRFVRSAPSPRKPTETSVSLLGKAPQRTLVLFAIGFLSGFYVLTLETVLIRLVGLSSGSSNYNFTLIVSIFVFGLGIGSLLIRQIGQLKDSHLFWNQLAVSVLLLIAYATVDFWPYWVHLVRIVFRDTVETFYFYQFALGMLFSAILLLPVALAGFTLPLCFHLVKDKKETLGYRVGQLYAINTVGCVIGALFGGYLLLKYVDLDVLFKICIGASLLSCAFAAINALRGARASLPFGWAGAAVFGVVILGLALLPRFDRDGFTQPFRIQAPVAKVTYEGRDRFVEYLSANTRYDVYRDGPNTSVGLGISPRKGEERSRTLLVNGKSDGNTSGDMLTMALTGHFPSLFAKNTERVCVIGFGTGVTAGTLAAYNGTREIHIAEIADTVIENASFFDSYNGGVSMNQKIQFHAMDAFRYLGATTDPFNVIVSEPSNPWVAGVENLYSKEFYSMVRNKLKSDGMFVQWVQSYSFDDELFQMVLRTITSEFPYVRVFQMIDHDFALVASNQDLGIPDLIRLGERMKNEPTARKMLEQLGVRRVETLLAYEVMPPALVRVIAGEGPIHQLEAPRLSHLAAKAFFAGNGARVQGMRRKYKEYFSMIPQTLLGQALGQNPPSDAVLAEFKEAFCSKKPSAGAFLCSETLAAHFIRYPKRRNEPQIATNIPSGEARQLASLTVMRKVRRFDQNDLEEVQKLFEEFKTQYSAIDRISIAPILHRLDGCLKTVPRKAILHGDCLIQKTAVYEILQPNSEELLQTIERYNAWFDQLDRDDADFPRFKRASDIMSKLVRDHASRS